jgi:hypothetical protein
MERNKCPKELNAHPARRYFELQPPTFFLRRGLEMHLVRRLTSFLVRINQSLRLAVHVIRMSMASPVPLKEERKLERLSSKRRHQFHPVQRREEIGNLSRVWILEQRGKRE